MKYRTKERLAVGGAVTLAVVALVVVAAVYVWLAVSMFHAADRGDMPMTIAYGVIILALALGGRSSSRRSK